jgi:predicted N-acyltransferase
MKLKVAQSIASISAEAWAGIEPKGFPFARRAFFLALEESGSVGDRNGWLPFYLTAWDDSQLVGAIVLYGKTNSYGEYIFDFAWAQGYANSGLDYYPKLVAAIPFTAATGPKVLLKDGLDEKIRLAVTRALIDQAQNMAHEIGASSLHALFITEPECEIFETSEFLIRHSFQFHWQNKNYISFESFLSDLTSKRRKEISRERRQVAEAQVTIERLSGSQLTEEHADAMYEFYLSTLEKMGGQNYLTHDFFKKVFSNMKEHMLFVCARNTSGRLVAGALNYFGHDTLYGRNWGCLAEYKALHFELCYYQGIEFAIERGFKLFEAGAQGEHKLSRGFLPRLTYSAHKIHHPQFEQAIQKFIEHEKSEIKRVFATYQNHSPFHDLA